MSVSEIANKSAEAALSVVMVPVIVVPAFIGSWMMLHVYTFFVDKLMRFILPDWWIFWWWS